jgi:hypothetical protein
VFIEELEEDEAVEQHFVEEQTMGKDTWEENIIKVEEHLSLEVHVEYNKPQGCMRIQKHNEGWWTWRGMKQKL